MKKVYLVLAVLLIVSSILVGCQQKAADQSAVAIEEQPPQTINEPDKLVAGIVVKVLTGNSFQIDLARALEVAAEEYGFEYKTLAPQTFGDYGQQVDIVEGLIVEGVDLIVIAPSDVSGTSQVLQKAMDAGIPVVTIDTQIDNPNGYIAFIGPDNVQAAYEATKFIAEKMGGKGEFLHIEGDAGYSVTDDRKEGCLKALAEYPDIVLVSSQNGKWTHEGGLMVTENALQAYPNITGIFAANDDAALGAIQAFKNAGVRPFIAGFDGTPQGLEAINNGDLDATISFFPDKMADAAFRVGAAYIRYLNDGQLEYFKQWIDSGATLINADNLSQYN
jgi:ribose transport system substrate-binding protein